MDTLDDFLRTRPPTAARPLLGLTVLLVEDSRFASEAFRLLCLRSGARIRRADSLAAAHKHLCIYRPTVAIVDLGLPDGSGATLIEELAQATPRIEVILGTSGDLAAEALARAAGADGFLAKPITRLAEFQNALLRLLPKDRQPLGPRILSEDEVSPDPIALRDDLAHVADTLMSDSSLVALDYATQFLGGVAKTAGDRALAAQLDDITAHRKTTAQIAEARARLADLVQVRLDAATPI